MLVTFGFDTNTDQFVPTLEPSMSHEMWIDKDINLPPFIEKEFFVDNYYKLTFIVRFGLALSSLKNKDRMYRLLMLSGNDLYYACKLLTIKKRTALYTSCKAQLNKYLDGKKDAPIWTPAQTRCLCDDFGKEYVAKHISISKSLNVISSFT